MCRFNATAAATWFRTVAEGLPYGYHNMLFGWVDTPNANCMRPPCVGVVLVGLSL
jgi:hypothetical protein